MNIIHVLSAFEIGGQEVMAVELAARQVARGHAVTAISLRAGAPGPLAEAFARAGVRTLGVAKRGPTLDPTLIVRLAWAARTARAEAVHVHNHQPLVYGAPAGKAAGCVVVATRHGLDEGSPRRRWLRQQVARCTDAYVAVSDEVASNTRRHGIVPDAKLQVIENGIDLERYRARPDERAAVRAELGVPDGAVLLGTVCRLIDYKNVALLLRAALPHVGSACHLAIVGGGPERASLEAQARAHAAGTFVHFLGQRSDVSRLLSGMDLFVLASKTEGHPMVVIEAMATSVPVLATAVGGIPNMLQDGQTGYLSTTDEPTFAARLATALQERTRWPTLGAAARRFALATFSSESMADRYLALYQRLLATCSPPAGSCRG